MPTRSSIPHLMSCCTNNSLKHSMVHLPETLKKMVISLRCSTRLCQMPHSRLSLMNTRSLWHNPTILRRLSSQTRRCRRSSSPLCLRMSRVRTGNSGMNTSSISNGNSKSKPDSGKPTMLHKPNRSIKATTSSSTHNSHINSRSKLISSSLSSSSRCSSSPHLLQTNAF